MQHKFYMNNPCADKRNKISLTYASCLQNSERGDICRSWSIWHKTSNAGGERKTSKESNSRIFLPGLSSSRISTFKRENLYTKACLTFLRLPKKWFIMKGPVAFWSNYIHNRIFYFPRLFIIVVLLDASSFSIFEADKSTFYFL